VNDDNISGFLKCDGYLALKSSYSALYAVIGDAYFNPSIASNSSQFFIPDFRGIFLRGYGVQTINGVNYGSNNNIGNKYTDIPKTPKPHKFEIKYFKW
jgi:microcystin-dependent protein